VGGGSSLHRSPLAELCPLQKEYLVYVLISIAVIAFLAWLPILVRSFSLMFEVTNYLDRRRKEFPELPRTIHGLRVWTHGLKGEALERSLRLRSRFWRFAVLAIVMFLFQGILWQVIMLLHWGRR
jgi:hypothetical protein